MAGTLSALSHGPKVPPWQGCLFCLLQYLRLLEQDQAFIRCTIYVDKKLLLQSHRAPAVSKLTTRWESSKPCRLREPSPRAGFRVVLPATSLGLSGCLPWNSRLARPSTCPGQQLTFPPKTPSSLLPFNTSQLNNPLSLAPSGWAPRLLGFFQARRWGWDKGGASKKPPKKCPGDFESALPLFLERTVRSNPILTLNPEPPSPRAPGASPPSGPRVQVPASPLRPRGPGPQSSSFRPRGADLPLRPRGPDPNPLPSDPEV